MLHHLRVLRNLPASPTTNHQNSSSKQGLHSKRVTILRWMTPWTSIGQPKGVLPMYEARTSYRKAVYMRCCLLCSSCACAPLACLSFQPTSSASPTTHQQTKQHSKRFIIWGTEAEATIGPLASHRGCWVLPMYDGGVKGCDVGVGSLLTGCVAFPCRQVPVRTRFASCRRRDIGISTLEPISR
jgi:hypothetical protein